MRMAASIMPHLPLLQKRSREEVADFSERMFCSEFMSLVLERAVEMINQHLNDMAEKPEPIKFFHSLIPRHKELKTIHPGKFAEIITAEDVFKESEPPLMQLFFKKPPRSE